jgi:drug/metabolite transporter (DMT)-like permease
VMEGQKKGSSAPSKVVQESPVASKNQLIAGGACCGAALFLASCFQQFGMLHTGAGKAGFITALSIVFVPILGLLLKKTVSKRVWLSISVAVAGLCLLCIQGNFTINKGDLLVALGALFFAIHIMVIDYFSFSMDGVKMSCIQFFTASTLGIIPMLIFEAPSLTAIQACLFPLLYSGILSGGMGYTLQIIAQKDAKPVVVCLILSMESVFAVIAGCLLLHETLTYNEIGGSLLMFLAVILAQSSQERLLVPQSSTRIS